MTKRPTLLLTALSLAAAGAVLAQAPNLSRLPRNYGLSEDGTRLVRARTENAGLYTLDSVPLIELFFEEEDWFPLVDSTGLFGTLVYRGDTLREVFVEVKGSSTDLGNNTRKKSFNVEVDGVFEDQDIGGYTSLNLHSGIYDNSHLRESLFYDVARAHLPGAQSNWVELRVNGALWGAYINTQQIDKKFLRQWFFSDEGPRWRGEANNPGKRTGGPDTCAAPTAPGRFASNSSLIYQGPDTAAYLPYYRERGTLEPGSWAKLVTAIEKLNLTPAEQLADTLPKYIAVDEALWFLAHENLLTDEDGYLIKTQSDYQVYIDPTTGQLIPLEYDGNGGFVRENVELPPLFRADETCLALVHRLLSVPRWRQRYLAHYRTLVRERIDTAAINERLDEIGGLIDDLERRDSIGSEIASYERFLSGRSGLREVVAARFEYLDTLPELRASGITVAGVAHASVDADATAIAGGSDYFVTAAISWTEGPVGEVYLHTAPDPRVLPEGVSARFRENRMLDDGLHGDGAAGDGVYGARLTAQVPGALHRYYFEVTGATADAPSEIHPSGGEHDTYYFVSASPTATALGPVRINELVADNDTGATDEAGEFEDWVEFYNDSDAAVDLSGYGFSDDPERPRRFVFPDTVLAPRAFLTLWADDDESDGSMHASFKLSRGGEALALVDPTGVIVDSVAFPELPTDSAFARRPDGTGAFVIATPTFGATNVPDASGTRAPLAYAEALLFPNPSPATATTTTLRAPVTGLALSLRDALGRELWQVSTTNAREVAIPTGDLPAGTYALVLRGAEGTRALRLLRR